jgi:hypothetical protein
MKETSVHEARPRPVLSTAEQDNLAAILGFQFVQRWDLFAQQLDDGRYVCIREPLRHEHLVAHLNGEITLGMYMLNEDSYGKHLVFDADDAPGWRRLKALADVLFDLETSSYLESSRRGGHLWLFFEDLISGETIRKFGQGLMLYFGMGGLELFPKQNQLSGGPGSLIRMPFGIHRKTGRRYGFLSAEGKPLAPTLREQICLFDTRQPVPQEVIERFSAHAPVARRRISSPTNSARTSSVNGDEIPLHERLKSAISVRDFVGHYVVLSPSGTGLCPFHNDHVDSFSVSDKRNLWYCFACETGGSILDFWMQYRECEFKVAVEELANMLL